MDHPDEAFDRSAWAGLSTPLISDCLGRFQALDAGIRLLAGDGLHGPAFPVQTMAGENSTIHLALGHCPRGSVLVIDAGGYPDRAVWGEVLTVAAEATGVAGLVLDGTTRDLAAIRRRGFSLYGRGACPSGPHKGWRGRIGEPVQCGGVVVNPGDLVIGDDDGVVVVPREMAEHVRRAALERKAQEERWIERIRAGEPSAAVLGLVGQENGDAPDRDDRHG